METLEQRVIAWLTSEGLDVGGAPCARGTSLVAFVQKEVDREVAPARELLRSVLRCEDVHTDPNWMTSAELFCDE